MPATLLQQSVVNANYSVDDNYSVDGSYLMDANYSVDGSYLIDANYSPIASTSTTPTVAAAALPMNLNPTGSSDITVVSFEGMTNEIVARVTKNLGEQKTGIELYCQNLVGDLKMKHQNTLIFPIILVIYTVQRNFVSAF